MNEINWIKKSRYLQRNNPTDWRRHHEFITFRRNRNITMETIKREAKRKRNKRTEGITQKREGRKER